MRFRKAGLLRLCLLAAAPVQAGRRVTSKRIAEWKAEYQWPVDIPHPAPNSTYPYVCLMPGHGDMLGMKGELVVGPRQ